MAEIRENYYTRLLLNLRDQSKSERDATFASIVQIFQDSLLEPDWPQRMETMLLDKVTHSELRDHVHGAMIALVLYLESPKYTTSETLKNRLLASVPQLLLCEDRAVLFTLGDLVRCLCYRYGFSTYEQLKDEVHDAVERCLARHLDRLPVNVEGPPAISCLDGLVRIIEAMLGGCGAAFVEHLDEQLFSTVLALVSHTSASVRELGYRLVASFKPIFPAWSRLTGRAQVMFASVVDHLALGLSADYEPVRLMALLAARDMLTSVDEDRRVELARRILPQLCFNRYFPADGIRLISHDVWKMVTDGRGQLWVELDFQNMIGHDTEQSTCPNPQVREASVHCLGELIRKMPEHCIQSSSDKLADILLRCGSDSVWGVREAALITLGQLVHLHPVLSQPFQDDIKARLEAGIRDHVQAVRRGAAHGIALAYRSGVMFSKEELSGRISATLRAVLVEGVSTPIAQRHHVPRLPTCFHVDNLVLASPNTEGSATSTQLASEVTEHANTTHPLITRPLPSCRCIPGRPATKEQSLPPLSACKAESRGVCSAPVRGSSASPSSESLRLADSMLYLLGELAASNHPASVPLAVGHVGDVSELLRVCCDEDVLRSALRELMVIISHMTKLALKQCLENVIPPLLDLAQSDDRSISDPSRDSLLRLESVIGRSIFLGRLELMGASFVESYRRILR